MDPAAVSPVQVAPLTKSVWYKYYAFAVHVFSGELLSDSFRKNNWVWGVGEEEGCKSLCGPRCYGDSSSSYASAETPCLALAEGLLSTTVV